MLLLHFLRQPTPPGRGTHMVVEAGDGLAFDPERTDLGCESLFKLSAQNCSILQERPDSGRLSRMANPATNSIGVGSDSTARPATYWRIEGSLLELGALRPVGFFTWNAQSFAERWARRAGMAWLTVTRPIDYAVNRKLATRLLHTLLRGVSRDRLDLLGEEYFHYVLKPQLRREAVEKLLDAAQSGERIVLVGQLLDHILRPLAQHLGVESFLSNRMEFRNGYATGRLLDPVVRPRGPFAWLTSGATDGRITREKLLRQLGWTKKPERLESAVQTAVRPPLPASKSVTLFNEGVRNGSLAVRETLAGRHILLIGVTGFIGKVWL